MQFREFFHRTKDYQAAVDLRERILRRPLGLVFNPEILELESKDRHFGIWDSDRLVACVVISPISQGEVKLRQMCVEDTIQGQGLGRQLIEETEERLRQDGIQKIQLAARIVVQGFYERLGYQVDGVPFLEVTIPHIKMVKDL